MTNRKTVDPYADDVAAEAREFRLSLARPCDYCAGDMGDESYGGETRSCDGREMHRSCWEEHMADEDCVACKAEYFSAPGAPYDE